MPQSAPQANQIEIQASGAHLRLVPGTIADAAREAATLGFFDLSTFKEPYRVEGKKTLGFELAWQLDWCLPEVIIYPTGGGTGLIGMWKAFAELESLGWLDGQRPRMVVVQAEGCAPVVRAYEQGGDRVEPWENPQTHAAGLCVPAPFAGSLMLEVLRESNGTAVAVSELEIRAARQELAAREGIDPAPEGAATFAAAIKLKQQGFLAASQKVVLFNTATGLKYPL